MSASILHFPGYCTSRLTQRSTLFWIASSLSLSLFLGVSPALAISGRVLLSVTGENPDDLMSACAVADFNGDGFPDLLAGAGGYGVVDEGRAYVYFGGPNADSIADLSIPGAGGQFGAAVAAAGDMNGDGTDDFAVGGPNDDAVFVFLGGPNIDAVADLIIAEQAGSSFGASIDGAGDVNGDGFDDLVVGARSWNSGGVSVGAAFLYFGGSTLDPVADLAVTGENAFDLVGYSVAGVGDANGDGYSDFFVGASRADAFGTDSGAAYLYYGGASVDGTADLVVTGEAAEDELGRYVSGAGDVNGDGFSDLIVSALFHDSGGENAGRTYVYYGGPSADPTPDLQLTGTVSNALFGVGCDGAGDVNGDGYSDLIVTAGATTPNAWIYHGGPGADETADFALSGESATDAFGSWIDPAGDFDGDGFDDVVIGAMGNDGGGTQAGRVYVMTTRPYRILSPNGTEQWVTGQPAIVRWLGHLPADLAISFDGGSTWETLATGVGGSFSNEFVVTVPGPVTSLAKLRISVSGASVDFASSDVSDDPFRIVTATSPPRFAHRLQGTLAGANDGDSFGISVARAGDFNGDGFEDVIVGASANDAGGTDTGAAYLYYGGPDADLGADLVLIGESAADLFGFSVAGAGDVNGDGFGDVIVGAWGNDATGSDAGRAYLYLGGPVPDASADLVLTGAAGGDHFGGSVAGAGDFDGDGFSDWIVGANFSDAGASNAGSAYIYYGGAAIDGTADLVLTGIATFEQFGVAVAGAGDVNGDGFDDCIVGAIFNDAGGPDAGRAYVFLGGPAADAQPDLLLTGDSESGYFGASVAGAGDVNADGFDDLLVGASGVGSSAGAVHVYHGGSTLDDSPDLVVFGENAGDLFGAAVSAAGDVNGDGFADVIAGAEGNDEGGSTTGRAYVFLGGTAMDSASDLTFTGGVAREALGHAVCGADDRNGDGFADLLVGANGNGAGVANIYDCGRYFLLTPNDGEEWNVGATATVAWIGAERADLWISADAGASWHPLASDVGGGATNAATVQVPHLPTRFGRVKVSPRDPAILGDDRSDSLFTIQSSVALLDFAGSLGENGAELSWNTEPGVGPEGLAGYVLYRVRGDGEDLRVGPEILRENRFVDAEGTIGSRYRLAAVNGIGQEMSVGQLSLTAPVPLAAGPLPYRAGELTVSFATAGGLGGGAAEATLDLFDIAGRKLRSLVRAPLEAGYHTAVWDGRDESGRQVESGVYFLRARSQGHEEHLKIVVAR